MSQYDTQSVHEFLTQTPESGLRKMLIDKVKITDVHCNLLIKIVRACSAEQFGQMLEQKEFPKIRLSPAESKIKEKFWQDCVAALLERGLLQTGGSSQKTAS